MHKERWISKADYIIDQTPGSRVVFNAQTSYQARACAKALNDGASLECGITALLKTIPARP